MNLEQPEPKLQKEEGRRTGQTTRRADALIQELFTMGKVRVVNHPLGKGMFAQRDSDLQLFYIISNRLKHEHSHHEFRLMRGDLEIILVK